MKPIHTIRRIAISFAFLLGTFWSFAAIFTVTNTTDAGAGSLRQAILDANASPGLDTIAFNIPGATAQVITPGVGGLPSIDDALFINGYSQPGAVQGTMLARTIRIVLRGTSAGAVASGLSLNANNITVCGLAIHSFMQNGIDVLNGVDNLVIWGNFIGSDQNGSTDLGNSVHGINLGEFGPGGSDNVIIGTNSDGIGDSNEGNLISGNGQDGILGWALTNSIMSGNFIGSNRFGIGTALGNGRNGILLTVNSNSNRIGILGDFVNDGQEPNGIIRNAGRGILISANSNGNVVSGNIVGMNTAGTAAGNFTNGVEILNSSNNRIGINPTHANYAPETNVIVYNVGNGISITAQDFFGFNFNTSNNIIAGNHIGTTPNNLPKGNAANGIVLSAANGLLTTQNVIGSNNDGVLDNFEGNLIAYNGNMGITSTNSFDISGNKFSRNSIYSNINLGIDLSGNGVSANDDGDGDVGPNELYNFPVIVSSRKVGTDLLVRGITRPSSIVEVYVADGSGEGVTFLFREQEGGANDLAAGDSTYTDPSYGTFTDRLFEFSVPLSSLPSIPGGSSVLAIAIKPALNDSSTSEFGPSLSVMPVSLSTFQGNLNNGKVYLTWSSSYEANSSHFVVEKSIDGSSYKSIGQVKSGSASRQYSFIDNTSLGKVNFYRLQQVDYDGKVAYSRVLIIRNDISTTVMNISPNPIVSSVNISLTLESDEVIKIHFFDQLGRQVKQYNMQGKKGLNAFTINDLNSLPDGIYAVEAIGNSIKARQQVIIKK